MNTYIHTYIQTYKHTYIQTYKHTYRHTYIHTYLHMFRDSGVFPHIFLLDQVTLTFKVYGILFDIVATCCNADDSQFFVPAIDLVNLDQWVMWKLGGFIWLSQDTLIRLILHHSCKTSDKLDKPSLTTTVSPRCIVNTKIVMNNNKYTQNSFVFWHRNYRKHPQMLKNPNFPYFMFEILASSGLPESSSVCDCWQPRWCSRFPIFLQGGLQVPLDPEFSPQLFGRVSWRFPNFIFVFAQATKYDFEIFLSCALHSPIVPAHGLDCHDRLTPWVLYSNHCYDHYCWTYFTGNGDHSPENAIHHNTIIPKTPYGVISQWLAISRVTLSNPPLLKPLNMQNMLKLVKGGT